MNRQNFLGEGQNYNGMFPISANTLNFMQEQTEFVSQLASAFGDNVLLKRKTGTKDGLIVLNGELLPLRKGTSNGGFYNIYEEKNSITAQGTLFANARVVRYVEQQSSQGDVFVEVSDVTDLAGRASEGETIANQFLPKGAIIMWSGSWSAIPKGFALCNGNNGEPINDVIIPDLRGKFIVGGDGRDSDFDTPGSVDSQGHPRGSKTQTLNINQIPAHTHTYLKATDGIHNDGGTTNQRPLKSLSYETQNTGSTGKSTPNPINILPPYYVLAFLIKVI